MQKAILMSVLFALICTPLFAARERSGRRAVGKLLLIFLTFSLVYLVIVGLLYPYLQ